MGWLRVLAVGVGVLTGRVVDMSSFIGWLAYSRVWYSGFIFIVDYGLSRHGWQPVAWNEFKIHYSAVFYDFV